MGHMPIVEVLLIALALSLDALAVSVAAACGGRTASPRAGFRLAFHFGLKDKHKIWATDLKAKTVTVLEPKGSGSFPADANFGREATYLPDDDLVLIPTGCKPAAAARTGAAACCLLAASSLVWVV